MNLWHFFPGQHHREQCGYLRCDLRYLRHCALLSHDINILAGWVSFISVLLKETFPPGLSIIITVRNSSWGKVIFSQAPVILSTGGGVFPLGRPPLLGRHPLGRHLPGQTPPWADTPQADTPLGRHPRSQTPPWADTPHRDDHCSGWYTSYWNAFLLINIFLKYTCRNVFTL